MVQKVDGQSKEITGWTSEDPIGSNQPFEFSLGADRRESGLTLTPPWLLELQSCQKGGSGASAGGRRRSYEN